MIRIENLNKSYGDQPILRDINIEFKPGEITVILGPSGCGKSTLLKLINRTIDPDQGQIFIKDKNVLDQSKTLLKRSIGYAIQGVGLFPHMTVKKNISTVPRLLKWPKEKINQRVDDLMDIIKLDRDFLKKYPIQLSGGEAQRVGVARALAGNPDILLMDEPFGALDPITRRNLQEALLDIQKQLKKTIVFVTHDVSEALLLADRLILMKDNQIVKMDTPYRIVKESKELLKTFTGGSFAYELLEKHQIKDHIKDLKVSVKKPNELVQATMTLKDCLSELILNEGNKLGVVDQGTTYDMGFSDIMSLIKGINHEA
jgi:osmoprotectant transport system ATP-binding protein